MTQFLYDHPFMTFFLVLAAIQGIVTIFLGRRPNTNVEK